MGTHFNMFNMMLAEAFTRKSVGPAKAKTSLPNIDEAGEEDFL